MSFGPFRSFAWYRLWRVGMVSGGIVLTVLMIIQAVVYRPYPLAIGLTLALGIGAMLIGALVVSTGWAGGISSDVEVCERNPPGS